MSATPSDVEPHSATAQRASDDAIPTASYAQEMLRYQASLHQLEQHIASEQAQLRTWEAEQHRDAEALRQAKDELQQWQQRVSTLEQRVLEHHQLCEDARGRVYALQEQRNVMHAEATRAAQEFAAAQAAVVATDTATSDTPEREPLRPQGLALPGLGVDTYKVNQQLQPQLKPTQPSQPHVHDHDHAFVSEASYRGPVTKVGLDTTPSRVMVVTLDLHGPNNVYVGFSDDVATGGIFVATYELGAIGDVVQVELTLPGSTASIHTRAKVTWTRELYDGYDTHHARHDTDQITPGVGLQLLDLSREVLGKLTQFARQRDPLFFPEDVLTDQCAA